MMHPCSAPRTLHADLDVLSVLQLQQQPCSQSSSGCIRSLFHQILPMQVDNVILRDPPMQRSPLFVGLDLTPLLQPQQQPCPGAYFQPLSLSTSKSSEALLKAQAPALEDTVWHAEHWQHARHNRPAEQDHSVLQQLSYILQRDAEWLQVVGHSCSVLCHCLGCDAGLTDI